MEGVHLYLVVTISWKHAYFCPSFFYIPPIFGCLGELRELLRSVAVDSFLTATGRIGLPPLVSTAFGVAISPGSYLQVSSGAKVLSHSPNGSSVVMQVTKPRTFPFGMCHTMDGRWPSKHGSSLLVTRLKEYLSYVRACAILFPNFETHMTAQRRHCWISFPLVSVKRVSRLITLASGSTVQSFVLRRRGHQTSDFLSFQHYVNANRRPPLLFTFFIATTSGSL